MKENVNERLKKSLEQFYQTHLQGEHGYPFDHVWQVRRLVLDQAVGVPWSRNVKPPFSENASLTQLQRAARIAAEYVSDPALAVQQHEKSKLFTDEARRDAKRP